MILRVQVAHARVGAQGVGWEQDATHVEALKGRLKVRWVVVADKDTYLIHALLFLLEFVARLGL